MTATSETYQGVQMKKFIVATVITLLTAVAGFVVFSRINAES